MEAYKEGFSAVGFKCENRNIRTGVVNLNDAVDIITELTRDGCQVEIKFYFFLLLKFSINIFISVIMTCLRSQCALTDWRRLPMDIFESRFLTR